MKRILVLFPKDWDRLELDAPHYRERYRFYFEGFDLFRFPANARLLTFNAFRFIDRLVDKYRRIGIDGVISNNEYFGALMAAVIARRLGLPGTDPRAVIVAQHKYCSRMLQRQVVPEATPAFSVFDYDIRDPAQLGLDFPCFIKPLKATFSVLARRVDDFGELRRHLGFRVFEKLIIQRLLKPFNDLMPVYMPFAMSVCNMIAEEVIEGEQVNIDGYVDGGKVTFLGMVDEIMYPGTHAFMRFEYPSRLAQGVRSRMAALTERLLRAMNYDHGFFNVEMYYRPAHDDIKIIEINPRMASQLANLYRRVDGHDPYDALLALSVGERPRIARGAGEFKTAGSFVFRRFDGRAAKPAPSAAQLDAIRRHYPDARLMLYLKRGVSLAREMKWLGSHRYAVHNLGGASRQDLHDRYNDIRRRLAFD
jgi:biotin carboxylase